MRQHKKFSRILSMLLVVATLFSLLAVPANAASLKDSGSVTLQHLGRDEFLRRRPLELHQQQGTDRYRLLRQLGAERSLPQQGAHIARI